MNTSPVPPVLRLAGVHKSFGKTEIIRGVDLDLIEGERHALIGPNGAGKSTLFNLISGRLHATAGSVQLRGADITQGHAAGHQPDGPGAQFSGHQPVSPDDGIREPALRGAVVARRRLHVLAQRGHAA